VAHVDDLQGGDGLGEVDTAAVQAGELAEAQASAEQGQGAALAKGGRADLGGQVALPAAHVGGADGLDRAVTEPGRTCSRSRLSVMARVLGCGGWGVPGELGR
jgi:hypothetical protein